MIAGPAASGVEQAGAVAAITMDPVTTPFPSPAPYLFSARLPADNTRALPPAIPGRGRSAEGAGDEK
ncbi:MAG TPA: hypothetical protein PKJ46_03305 [Methanoculleus sp.]|nr:hypothetical protein [Methanoculleus sp.]